MTEDRGRMNDYTNRLSDTLADDTPGYTVGANDSTRTEDNKSSEEIKAEIEQKRNEMGHKINMIQERLDPTRLKEQAQETVRSAVSDSADAVVEYVRDNIGGVGYTVVDTIKRNPLPAALIGIGVGWLLIKSYSNSSSDWQNPDDRDRQRYNSGRSGNGYPQSSNRYGYQANAGPYGSEYGSSTGAQYGADYGSDQSRYDYEAGGENGGQYRGSQYQRGQTGSTGGYGAGRAEGYQAQSRVGQTAQYAQDKASNALDQAKDTASQLSEQVQEKVGDVLDKARDTAGQLTDQVQDTAQQTGDYVQQKVSQVRDQAQQTFQQTGRQVQQTAQQNPLAFGIAALVAGALIGMALPETQMENEMLGDTRDQLLDNAQSVAQDVKQRVQTIVDDKLPEVKQTVQKVADDLKQTGKTAAEDLKQTLKDTGESVKQGANELAQTGKDAAKDVAETGKDAAKDAGQAVKNSGTTTDAWSPARTGTTQTSGSVTDEYKAPEEEGSTKNAQYGQISR